MCYSILGPFFPKEVRHFYIFMNFIFLKSSLNCFILWCIKCKNLHLVKMMHRTLVNRKTSDGIFDTRGKKNPVKKKILLGDNSPKYN